MNRHHLEGGELNIVKEGEKQGRKLPHTALWNDANEANREE